MLPLDTEAYGQKIEETIVGLGEHAAIAEGRRWYGARCDLFDSRRDELTAQYPDQFVAMAEDGAIIASATLDGLFTEIDRRGVARGTCVVEFLNSEPVVWQI